MKLLKGKVSIPETSHSLGDKTIADVCEALMGAAFLTHTTAGPWKPEKWTNAVVAVTKLVGSPDHAMLSWSDYSKAYVKPDYQMAKADGAHLSLCARIEEVHKYHFRYPRLLQSVVNHPSNPSAWSKGIPSYQRLEFLGDSLLDMACITHIFNKYPEMDPQWLTEHKMAMVSNRFLGVVSVKMGFDKHIRQTSSTMKAQMDGYKEELQGAEAMAQGAKDFWTAVREPPKVRDPRVSDCSGY